MADCGPCHVKLRCGRYSVHVDWPYAGFNCKGDLQNVRVEDFATTMEWNVPSKKWSNEAKTSKPPFVQLNCPSLDFPREIAQACGDSLWCKSWEIADMHGRAVECAATNISTLDVEFDEPPCSGRTRRDHEHRHPR